MRVHTAWLGAAVMGLVLVVVLVIWATGDHGEQDADPDSDRSTAHAEVSGTRDAGVLGSHAGGTVGSHAGGTGDYVKPAPSASYVKPAVDWDRVNMQTATIDFGLEEPSCDDEGLLALANSNSCQADSNCTSSCLSLFEAWKTNCPNNTDIIGDVKSKQPEYQDFVDNCLAAKHASVTATAPAPASVAGRRDSVPASCDAIGFVDLTNACGAGDGSSCSERCATAVNQWVSGCGDAGQQAIDSLAQIAPETRTFVNLCAQPKD